MCMICLGTFNKKGKQLHLLNDIDIFIGIVNNECMQIAFNQNLLTFFLMLSIMVGGLCSCSKLRGFKPWEFHFANCQRPLVYIMGIQTNITQIIWESHD